MSDAAPQVEVIVPNLKRRFSGITSTLAQVLPRQMTRIRIAALGYPLPVDIPRISPVTLFRISRPAQDDAPPLIFHARRNIDMCLGLLLRAVFRRRLHLVFTSVAQRRHTAFTRFLYYRMDTLLSTSDRSASYLRRKPDAIIPHGTDTRLYRPADDRSAAWREGGLPGKHGVGIFGRVRPQKGHREFVRALCRVLPKHPEFTAVIIGETTPEYRPFQEELRREIGRHGLEERFHWLGKLPFSEIPAWFRRMSLVLAVPHNEGFGLTCLEAMASGAPVIATRTGGFERVIREGIDGYVVPCRDTDAIVRVLGALLERPETLESMGAAARERIESDFTVEREADALVDCYRNIQQRYLKPDR